MLYWFFFRFFFLESLDSAMAAAEDKGGTKSANILGFPLADAAFGAVFHAGIVSPSANIVNQYFLHFILDFLQNGAIIWA